MDIRVYEVYDPGEILPLYDSVGWTAYTARPEMLKRAFEKSLLALAAYEDGALAGILRCIGDGASIVFIQDILVHPGFQRRGIGSALLREAMKRFEGVYQLRLTTANTEKTIAFYRACGLVPDTELSCLGFSRVVY